MATIRNLTSNTILADRAEVAGRPVRRLVGLLSRRGLSTGEALVLPRCSAIHTWFMRFPIDVVFLRRKAVVAAKAAVRPFRLVWVRGADTVIELPAGTIASAGISLKQLIDIKLLIG